MKAYRETALSILLGSFYFIFTIAADKDDQVKTIFIGVMLFLPGILFPTITTYTTPITKNNTSKIILHLIGSVFIYHGAVWIFSGEARYAPITLLAGGLGSLLYHLTTKTIFKLSISISSILLITILSSGAFAGYSFIENDFNQLGGALFIWTIINGIFINRLRIKQLNLT